MISLVGQKFDRLVVVRDTGSRQCRKAILLCNCECGGEALARSDHLRAGRVRSCGCLRREIAAAKAASASAGRWRHGEAAPASRTPEYRVWATMIQRCHNPNANGFGDYGGRGITVCERWREDYAAFLADMGRRPTPTHTIERADNGGPYAPANCRWATRREQAANRRPRLPRTQAERTAA